jgi:hypothetical protein
MGLFEGCTISNFQGCVTFVFITLTEMSRTRNNGAEPLFLYVFATATETFVPVIHHLFSSSGEESMSECLLPSASLGFHLITVSEVFSFEMLPQ